jgi:hypothetical protein
VEVRLHDKGFLHAKAYLFHQDKVGPGNRGDRLRPFAAIVGSSNFTRPGLASNKELNLVHRVILRTEEAVDREAAERVDYLESCPRGWTSLVDPSGEEAIDQLLGYLTWRDCKCSLIIFNKQKITSAVAQKMHETMTVHNGHRKSSSYDAAGTGRHVFVTESDPGRELVITTVLFDIPERS